ncbi:MAG: Lin0512 family protein [Pseudomonadota bacterium]
MTKTEHPASAKKRIIVEMGMGTDLYGEDATKAARRAVQDAIHHSSLLLFRHLGMDAQKMEIELRIAAPDPDAVDLATVAAELPYGQVKPTATRGGLRVVDGDRVTTIVNVALIVRVDVPSVR